MKTHRAGYKTSEFWFTVVSFLFSGLYLVGVIGDSVYKDELIRDVSHAVESVILIAGQLLIVYNYMKSRQNIKQSELKSIDIPETPIKIEKNNDNKPVRKPRKSTKSSGNKTTDKSRSSSTRSRKTNNSN